MAENDRGITTESVGGDGGVRRAQFETQYNWACKMVGKYPDDVDIRALRDKLEETSNPIPPDKFYAFVAKYN
jgi:hypothetical protein